MWQVSLPSKHCRHLLKLDKKGKDLGSDPQRTKSSIIKDKSTLSTYNILSTHFVGPRAKRSRTKKHLQISLHDCLFFAAKGAFTSCSNWLRFHSRNGLHIEDKLVTDFLPIQIVYFFYAFTFDQFTIVSISRERESLLPVTQFSFLSKK